jgi:hypothetical protein
MTYFVQCMKMLCNGSYLYSTSFYKSISTAATSKSSTSNDIYSCVLKQSLSLDWFWSYYVGIDIKHGDLEQKHMKGPLLISVRSLLALTKKGVKMFRDDNTFHSIILNFSKNIS